ncbi:MAG: hypothetical protein AAFQ10_10435 [Pseudomonadota bacterium]
MIAEKLFFYTSSVLAICCAISLWFSFHSVRKSEGRIAARKLLSEGVDFSDPNYHEREMAADLVSYLAGVGELSKDRITKYFEDFLIDVQFEERLRRELHKAIADYIEAEEPDAYSRGQIRSSWIGKLEEVGPLKMDYAKIRTEVYAIVEGPEARKQTLSEREAESLLYLINAKKKKDMSFSDRFVEDKMKSFNIMFAKVATSVIAVYFGEGRDGGHSGDYVV